MALPEILTVTLNPAIDETVFLDELRPGSVNRALRLHRQPGGKGVNVSAMLGGYGIPSMASGFLGRENAQRFEELFRERGIRDEFVRVAGETRTGIKIVARSTGETTDLNFDGVSPTAEDLDALEEKLLAQVRPGVWCVIGGRLPKAVSIEGFKGLLESLKKAGGRLAVDTSGEALRVAIESGVDLIKPNHHELEEVLGVDLPDLASRVAAARRLWSGGIGHVILSLGGEGALFVSGDGAFHADAPPVAVVSTVGAGDSMLAGYLAGLVTDRSPEECGRLASVFAWCALEDVGRVPPTRELAEERMGGIGIRMLED